jgi:phosphatidylinositol glycan class S
LHPLERDIFHLTRAMHQVAETLITLNALKRMTDSLLSLPITSRIANLFKLSVLQCTQAKSIESTPMQRYLDSFGARTLADTAFFDKDMVGLVYFPDEHKYAVYMPLFVPVFATLLGVLVKEARQVHDSRKRQVKG